MTDDDTARQVRLLIARVAPDVDPEAIGPDDDLLRTLGIDSFDHLRVLIAVHERFGIDIPEADHGKLRTVRAITDHIRAGTNV